MLANCGCRIWKKPNLSDRASKDFEINLSGAMQLCTEFYPLLVKSQGLISIDSVASINPAVNNPAYSASKAGLVQLTKALAKKPLRCEGKYGSTRHGADKMTANQSGPEQKHSSAK